MKTYRKEAETPSGQVSSTFWVGCSFNKGCDKELPFSVKTGELPIPSTEYVRRNGWEVTQDQEKAYCPEHRIQMPVIQPGKMIDEFFADHVSLAASDPDGPMPFAPTTRLWEEFERYVDAHPKGLLHPVTRRDLYAAARLRGFTDGVRALTIDGKATSTPTFKAMELRTTTEPADHDEWFARRKGGQLVTRKKLRRKTLDDQAQRTEARRARQRQDPTEEQLLDRFVETEVKRKPSDRTSVKHLHEAFLAWARREGHEVGMSTRRMVEALRGRQMQSRRTSYRPEGGGKPIGITVYDDIWVPKPGFFGPPPPEPRSAIFCAAPICHEAAQTATAGDLGWVKDGEEHYCLGHAVDREVDLVGALWPSRETPARQKDLDNPGPRGYEIAESDVILDEDLDPDAALEAAIKAFEAEPEDGPRLNPDEYDFD